MIKRVKIRASFLIYSVLLALIGGWKTALCVCLTLFIHETAHVLTMFCFGDCFEHMEITPFGGVITLKSGALSGRGVRGAIAAAAGPLANYLAVLLLASPLCEWIIDAEFKRTLMIANCSMMLLNMMPALPLDGGRIVFSAGYYFFPVGSLVSILAALGRLCGAALLCAAVYGWYAWGIVNLSLLFAGGYMLYEAGMQRVAILAENLYAVVHEHLCSEEKCSASDVVIMNYGAELRMLIPMLRTSRRLLVAAEGNGELRFYEERCILQHLLENPTQRLMDIVGCAREVEKV